MIERSKYDSGEHEECLVRVCLSVVGVHADNKHYGDGTWTLPGTTTGSCPPESLPSRAQGDWIPVADGPPPAMGQVDTPQLSGYSQAMMPSLSESERQAESGAEPLPHDSGLLPIQPGSYYPPPGDALHLPLSSPPTEAQGQDGRQSFHSAQNVA